MLSTSRPWALSKLFPPTRLTGFSLSLSGMQAQLSVVYTRGVGDAVVDYNVVTERAHFIMHSL